MWFQDRQDQQRKTSAPLSLRHATVVRIAYILTSQGNPFFSVPIVDMRYNWDFAGEILAKGISGVSPDLLG